MTVKHGGKYPLAPSVVLKRLNGGGGLCGSDCPVPLEKGFESREFFKRQRINYFDVHDPRNKSLLGLLLSRVSHFVKACFVARSNAIEVNESLHLRRSVRQMLSRSKSSATRYAQMNYFFLQRRIYC